MIFTIIFSAKMLVMLITNKLFSLVRENFMLRRVPTIMSSTVENWKSTKSIF